MAGPGGRSAGRVSVRVVPDATGFGADLKEKLDRIESGLKIEVGAVLNDDKLRAQLARLEQTKVELDATVSTASARSEIERVGKSGGKVELPVSLSGQQIVRAELIRLAANRVIDLVVNVNKRSLAAAGGALASLSGGRNAVGYLKGIGSALSGLDKSVPRIALVASTVGSIGALGLSSVGGLLSLASSLTAVAGAGLAVPGILAGIGVAGGTLAIALSTAGTVLADLLPQFVAFQQGISKNFFAVAEGPIRDLVATALPALQSGLGRVSTSLGGFAATAASALGRLISSGDLSPLFDNTAAAIDRVQGAIQPVLSSLSTLVTFGSSYLPGLAGVINDLADRFNEFIQTAAADGSLKDWVDTGLSALRSLGSVVVSVGGIVKGLFDAANAGTGGNGLAVLADALRQVSDAINSSGLQTALSTIFAGAAAGAQGLAAAIRPIGGLFATLAPQIAGALEAAGTVVGQALGGIAKALSQPAVADGLTSLFAGITTGVNAILPVLPALGEAFGTVLQTLGQVAAQLGPVFAASFAAIAPVVTTLLTALQPLIPVLGSALADSVSILSVALAALAPVFAEVITAVAPLIPILAAGLANAVTTLAPAVLALVAAIGPALVPTIVSLVTAVAQVAPLFAQFLVAVAPLVPAILALVPPLLQIAVTFLTQLLPAITALLPQITALLPQFVALLTSLVPLAAQIAQFAAAFLQLAVVIQQPIFAPLLTAFTLVASGLQGLLGILTGFISAAVALFTGNFAAIPGIIGGIFGSVNRVFASGLAGPAGLLQAFVANALNRIGAFGAGIVSATTSAMARFGSAISSGISQAVSFIASLPGKAKSALGNVGNVLFSAGADLVRGMINGIKSAVGGLIAAASDMVGSAISAAKHALDSHSPSRVFRAIGVTIPQGAALGVGDGTPALNRAVEGMVKIPDVGRARVATSSAYASDVMSGTGGGRQLTIQGDVVNTNISDLVEAVMREFRLQEAAAQGAGF